MAQASQAERVLIGTAVASEVVAKLASQECVRVTSDAGELKLLAAEFAVIVVDRDWASLEPSLWREVMSQGSRATHDKVAFLVGSERLVVIARRAMDAAVRLTGGSLAMNIVQLLFETRDQSGAELETVPQHERRGLARLTKQRSPEEAQTLRRRATEAAFVERKRLLNECFSTKQVSNLLGLSRQTPHDRVKAGKLLAIEDGGQLWFPRWQFDPDGPNGVVEGLTEVLSALSVGPFSKARWLSKPNQTLEGRTPIQALKSGERERVVSEALAVSAAAGAGGG